MPDSLCFGSIAFINSLPVDGGLLKKEIPCPAKPLRQVPSELNRLMLKKQLILSPVSALHFLEHADQYMLLPDLSISSQSGVDSVLLFSKVPISKLGSRQIMTTGQGRSTPGLLHMLLKKKYGLDSILRVDSMPWQNFLESDYDAMLLIGDTALHAANSPCGHLASDTFIYDLAEEWQSWTGKPFVFALWVVHRGFLSDNKRSVESMVAALYESRSWGLQNKDEIVKMAAEDTGLKTGVLKKYFEHLRFDFQDELKQGLQIFADHALEMKWIHKKPDLYAKETYVRALFTEPVG